MSGRLARSRPLFSRAFTGARARLDRRHAHAFGAWTGSDQNAPSIELPGAASHRVGALRHARGTRHRVATPAQVRPASASSIRQHLSSKPSTPMTATSSQRPPIVGRFYPTRPPPGGDCHNSPTHRPSQSRHPPLPLKAAFPCTTGAPCLACASQGAPSACPPRAEGAHPTPQAPSRYRPSGTVESCPVRCAPEARTFHFPGRGVRACLCWRSQCAPAGGVRGAPTARIPSPARGDRRAARVYHPPTRLPACLPACAGAASAPRRGVPSRAPKGYQCAARIDRFPLARPPRPRHPDGSLSPLERPAHPGPRGVRRVPGPTGCSSFSPVCWEGNPRGAWREQVKPESRSTPRRRGLAPGAS
jgi:hypothetical protein